ncbi:metallophosphoesterase [Macrococcus animalis]|uniref:metallophosphoesterase n=1 Tax=Macrococcus animalis TaxID=3395467 RepID=UPI0039BDFC33
MLKDIMFSMIDRFGKKLVPLFHTNPKKVAINQISIKVLQQRHTRPLSIVHISDLHIGFQYDYNDLMEHIKIINDLSPDMVMITGDLFDNLEKFDGNPFDYVPLLKTIKVPLGTYFSYGNHDQRSELTKNLETVLFNSHIEVLNNFGKYIQFENENIYICGTDDIINASGNIEQAIRNRIAINDPTIALVHEPDYADFVKKFNVNIQLSGHSHGGQIYFPLIGAPIKPGLARKYLKGLHKLRYKKNILYLHVSRGLGTTHLPIRFFAKPQITKIYVK